MKEDSTLYPNATKSLLEQIGIDPQDFEWQLLAACKDYPFNLFFESYERDIVQAKQVDALCVSCPVAKECFELGTSTKSTGVFGGFYLIHGVPAKYRNAHKEEATALRLAEKIFHE